MKPTPETFPFPLIVLDETDSTNRFLTTLCNEQSDPVRELTVVHAEYQSAGKGQRGNSWESAAGANLLFSFVLYPQGVPARAQFILSQLLSLAIRNELNRRVGEVTIKWPNDIYWRDKKMCGILIENTLEGSGIGRCVCGVGVNVNQTDFVSDAPNPVSLRQVSGQEYCRHTLLADIMRRFAADYTKLLTDGVEACVDDVSARYASALYRREGFHAYADAAGTFSARIVRVEPDGQFVLQDTEGGLRSYLFKEVSYIMDNG